MFCAATRPHLLSTHLSAPIAPRWSRPSGCKNAHRGPSGLSRSASAPTRSQLLIASGKNTRCSTIAPRTPLLPQGNQLTSEVTVTASAQGNPQMAEVVVTGTQGSPPVAQLNDLPPGIEIIIEGQRMSRGYPKLTPEQSMPPVPRGPVQSPVNPSTTPPPGGPGWLWWQMLQFLFRGWFGGGHSVVPPMPNAPPGCTPDTCA
jgi:hypothetical protein